MRRLADVYGQIASDRDHEARLCAEFALSGSWDAAAAAAKRYQVLQKRCEQIILGSPWLDTGVSPNVDG
jgi:hypothetical protein